MRVLLYLILGLLFFSCEPKNLPTRIVVNEQEISIMASHMTTKSELETFSNQLSGLGYKFDYSGSEFFDDGKLRRLNFIFILPTGKVATVAADLMNIQYKYHGIMLKSDGRLKSGMFE